MASLIPSEEHATALKDMLGLFSKKMEKGAVAMYLRVISGIPGDRIQECADRVVTRLGFFPAPAELIKEWEIMVDEYRHSKEYTDMCLEVARNIRSHNEYFRINGWELAHPSYVEKAVKELGYEDKMIDYHDV